MKITKPTREVMDEADTHDLTSENPWDPETATHGITLHSTRLAMAGGSQDRVNLKKRNQPKIDVLMRLLGVDEETAHATLQATNHVGKIDSRDPMRRHFKARHPALNVSRLEDGVGTDTIFPKTNVPTIHGETCAQVFALSKSRFLFVKLMKSESQGVSAMKEFILRVGAPQHLHSDGSKMQNSSAMRKLELDHMIAWSNSEPHMPWQNWTERRIQTLVSKARSLMDKAGAPEELWGHALLLRLGC